MINFNQKPLASFWSSVANKYPSLSKKATKVFLLYLVATTDMCNTAFSALSNKKTKDSFRIAIEADLQICLLSIALRIDIL